MQKLYDRIYWENDQAPALNDTNLNAMSKAIDDIDNRVVSIAPETLMQDITQLREDIAEVEADITEAERQVVLAQGYATNAANSAQAAASSAQIAEGQVELAQGHATNAANSAQEAAQAAAASAQEAAELVREATQEAAQAAAGSAQAAAASAQEAAEIVDLNWSRVTNKPFSTIGSNLSVDEQGRLNATAPTADDMVLTGYEIADNYTPIGATDTVNEAFAKLEAKPDKVGSTLIFVLADARLTPGLGIRVENYDTNESYVHEITSDDVTAGVVKFDVKSIGTWVGKYQIYPHPATIDMVQVTFYGTYTLFGSRANDSDKNLMANNLPFRFGYDAATQKYGYILPDGEGGADTVHPFSSLSVETILWEQEFVFAQGFPEQDVTLNDDFHNYQLIRFDFIAGSQADVTQATAYGSIFVYPSELDVFINNPVGNYSARYFLSPRFRAQTSSKERPFYKKSNTSIHFGISVDSITVAIPLRIVGIG